MRIGIGTDTHAFLPVDSDGFIQKIGLVDFQMPVKILATSDGDILVHAIIDALLSAARTIGETKEQKNEMSTLPPTIGAFFDQTNHEYAYKNELKGEPMLNAVLEAIKTKANKANVEFKIENIAASITSNYPKFSPKINEIEQKLSNILDAPFSLSATTADGVGEIGKGSGISVTATVLLK